MLNPKAHSATGYDDPWVVSTTLIPFLNEDSRSILWENLSPSNSPINFKLGQFSITFLLIKGDPWETIKASRFFVNSINLFSDSFENEGWLSQSEVSLNSCHV